MVLSEVELRQRLERLLPQRISNPDKANGKTAAVLVPFACIKNDWHLLFIRRAQRHGDIHSGQVAFPGGITDHSDDNARDTALREAEEEIGLSPCDVTLISEMQDYYSVLQYRVTPVIGFIPWPYAFSLQASEVSRAFTIPLNWLATPDNFELRVESGKSMPYYRTYRGEQLWGLTARITQALVKELMR